MSYEITVTYTPAIVRRAVRRFWFRFIAWHGFASVAVAIGVFVSLLAAGRDDWLVGVFGVLSLLLVLMGSGVYFTYLRRSLAVLRAMKEPKAVFRLTDERFGSESDVGKGELSWTAIKEIWAFPEVWLLFVAKNQFITLPIADVSDDARTFLRERVTASGGTVR